MPLWQRLVVTLLAMAAASLIVGLIWQALFGLELPSYVAGVVGGITAVLTWEFLTDSAQRARDPVRNMGAPARRPPSWLRAPSSRSISSSMIGQSTLSRRVSTSACAGAAQPRPTRSRPSRDDEEFGGDYGL
jgi:hypothetical protein